jgi:hypothetical protein
VKKPTKKITGDCERRPMLTPTRVRTLLCPSALLFRREGCPVSTRDLSHGLAERLSLSFSLDLLVEGRLLFPRLPLEEHPGLE